MLTLAAVPVFAGSVTLVDALPELQETVTGSPLSLVLLENLQLEAFATVADNVTRPPADNKLDGATVND